MKTVVGIYIYDQAEVLDFAGPFEVFSTASRLVDARVNDEGFDVHLIAEKNANKLVQARGGFCVQPMYSIHDHPALDVLIVAGGVHAAEMTKPTVTRWLSQQAAKTQITASVCTGAFLLAAANVLNKNHTVTTHWEDVADLRQQFPHLTVVQGQRWLDQSNIVTSGGISAGIDMALHLVHRLYSLELAERTARQMEFDWTKSEK